MKRLLLLFLLVGAGVCLAQTPAGWRYDNISLYNSSGYAKVVPFARITVCAQNATDGTRTTPCSPAIQTYGDPALVQALSTPASGDGDGNFFFYVAQGIYHVSVCSPASGLCKNLKDVAIGSSGSGGTSPPPGNVPQPVDVGVTYNGVPTASLTIIRHPFPFAVSIPAGCTNSYLLAETAATAQTVFVLDKCTAVGSCVQFGSATFAAAATNATFSCTNQTDFAVDDYIKLIAPGSPDATLALLGGSIYGTRAGDAATTNLAAVAFSGLYSDLLNIPVFATVATSGSYNDLANRPSFATVATSGSYNDLANTPTLGAAASKAVSGNTGTVASVSGSLTVSKQATFDASGNVVASIYDVGASGGTPTGSGDHVATASGVPADGCAQWSGGNVGSTGTACGAGGGGGGSGTVLSGTAGQFAFYSGSGTTVAGKTLAAGDIPTLAESQVTSLVSDLAAKVATSTTVNGHALSSNVTVTKSDVGLGNVDNTSDVNKPISTATQNALNLLAPLASPIFTGTVGGITKAMVGLGNVDNTSDVNKPVSTATQTALNLKANDTAVVHNTTNETVAGVKTFSSTILGNISTASALAAAGSLCDWLSHQVATGVDAHGNAVGCNPLAAVAVSGLYNDLSGRPTLATVATTGAYADLTGKPTLAANTPAVSNQFLTAYNSTSGAFTQARPTWANVDKTTSSIADIATRNYSDITGTPVLATVALTGQYSDLIGSPPSPLAFKGDLLTYSSSIVRFGVGANGTCLGADSAQATGLSWVSCSGTPGVGVPTGGTTSQVLAKISNTNFDTGWVTLPGSGTVTDTAGALTLGQLLIGNNGDDLKVGNLSGDVTTSGSAATTLANIPSGVAMAGSLLASNIAAPGSPASGKVSLFTDSTALRFHDKNASGVIGTTVVADTGASNQFLTAISAAGVISKAQPSWANIDKTVSSLADLTTRAYSALTGAPQLPLNTTSTATQFFTAYNSTTGAFTKAQPLWSDIDKATSSLADITTRNYSDLSGKPTLPANTTATATQFFTAYNSTTGAYTKAQPAWTDISGKPTIPAASTDLSDTANLARIGSANIFTTNQGVTPGTDVVPLTLSGKSGGLANLFLVKKGDGSAAFTVAADGSATLAGPLTTGGGTAKVCYNPPTNTVCDFAGTGSPAGIVIGDIGSTYRRFDGGSGATFYVKESNSGSASGWIAK